MNYLRPFGRGRGRPRRQAFTKARHLISSHSKSHLRQHHSFHAFQLKRQSSSNHSPNHRKQFNLYNDSQQTWAKQINQPPILLKSEQIQNWNTFKVQQLKLNRLYLWYVSKFEWIPMWSTENGFLLNNYKFISYDCINIKQLTKSNWIQQNSVSDSEVKLLFAKFNIGNNHIANPILVHTHKFKTQNVMYKCQTRINNR